MRTLGALAAHLAGDTHTLCLCLRLDLRDGTSLGLTNFNRDIAFDLGDGSLTYSAGGAAFSDVVLAAGLDASNFEVTGPVGTVFTQAHLLGGRFTGAIARLFAIDWSARDDFAALLRGRVSPPRVEGARFVMEVRGAADALNQSIGRALSPYCTASFGILDTGCPVTRTPIAATVVTVANAFLFTTDLAGAYADADFAFGTVLFQSGALAGTPESEMFAYDGAAGEVEMFVPLAVRPAPGDTLWLYPGCSRLIHADDPAVPTCSGYGVAEFHRGFADVPGSARYLKITPPGSSG